MAGGEMPLHETKVLAIASHVTYGYVGNKMATFVMQALGCDVSAIDTVHFSNHTAYKQFKGRRVPAEEIQDLWTGLKQSNLNDFEMMLSGYAASKEVVETIGKIARESQDRTRTKPGRFFWILDPVMGDEGRLYVAEDIVPMYRSLLPHADLILPNAFEAELLAEMKITDMKTLVVAISKLHKTYQVPHIIITSLRISPRSGRRKSNADTDTLLVVGSSSRSDHTPRIFSITCPSLPVFFSGTGDMFAALTLCRLREAVTNFTFETPESKSTRSLLETQSWQPPDSVPATSLPLAKATEKTLASMHAVLVRTTEDRHETLGEEVIEDGASEEGRAADASTEDEGERGESGEVRGRVEASEDGKDVPQFTAEAIEIEQNGVKQI